jgi:hypothetical protein
MLGTSLGREAQHSYARLCETGYRLGCLSRAYCYLRELCSIRHRSNSYVAYDENTILTILLLLGDEEQTATYASDTRSALDDLQCRTQSVACGREST